MGAMVAMYAIAGAFFLRFWSRTRDVLFACFALAFAILGLHQLALAISRESEQTTWLYGLRLAAFVMILLGIASKNRPSGTKG